MLKLGLTFPTKKAVITNAALTCAVMCLATAAIYLIDSGIAAVIANI